MDQIIKNLQDLRNGIFKDEDAVNELIDSTIEMASNLQAGVIEQPAPRGEGIEIGKLVVMDIESRVKKGIETYGEPLKANNGRKPLIDAYQEALDLAMYLRQAIREIHGG